MAAKLGRWRHKLDEARAYLAKEGPKETSRHALVSIRNHHMCTTCFCCACEEVLRNQGYEPRTGEKTGNPNTLWGRTD